MYTRTHAYVYMYVLIVTDSCMLYTCLSALDTRNPPARMRVAKYADNPVLFNISCPIIT